MSEHVLDDYGMPLPREEMRLNVGLVSEWYSQGETNAFHVLLKPGDLIEFQREGYCHWAVYIGEYALVGQGDDEVQLVRCVVHRANPTDRESLQNMFSTSRSVAKGVHGIGLVVKEPLGDVWGRSKARVNNGLDNSLTPFPSQKGKKVTERAVSDLPLSGGACAGRGSRRDGGVVLGLQHPQQQLRALRLLGQVRLVHQLSGGPEDQPGHEARHGGRGCLPAQACLRPR